MEHLFHFCGMHLILIYTHTEKEKYERLGGMGTAELLSKMVTFSGVWISYAQGQFPCPWNHSTVPSPAKTTEASPYPNWP